MQHTHRVQTVCWGALENLEGCPGIVYIFKENTMILDICRKL